MRAPCLAHTPIAHHSVPHSPFHTSALISTTDAFPVDGTRNPGYYYRTMAAIIDWTHAHGVSTASHEGIFLTAAAVIGRPRSFEWRAYRGVRCAGNQVRQGISDSLNKARLEAEQFARDLAEHPTPESTPTKPTTAKLERGQAVVFRKGRTHIRLLLAIVVEVTAVPVGPPGPNRHRYILKPARIQDGYPAAIECAATVDDIRASALVPYDETTHGGNLAKWRVL